MSNQRASLPVSSSSSSSFSTPQWKYDVFLSFRGEDTRNKFTDHLYAALNQRGIIVFRDDDKLERGKAITPALLKAISESRFSIVVFSRNYASSRWCLDELVKIVECMSKKGQIVLPVFYDVDPSEVRKQTGSFQEAFAKHEETFRENINKVQEWRTAITEVANLSGWHLSDRSEAKSIQDIVKAILCKLSHRLPGVVDGLVGIDFRVKELNSCLGEGLDDVRCIGICGMGGIGKTTIARVLYQRLSHQFEGSCFLVNVKEVCQKHGIFPLQSQLLSEVLMEPNIDLLNVYKGVSIISNRLRYKKVLIILDDVDTLEQLNMLVGDNGWFGPGSRIIITTRDTHLLMAHEVDMIYEVMELNDNESLKLLSRKAFKRNNPAKDYLELSNRVVNYAKGLPLALEVLGSFLYGKSMDVWKSALDRLHKIPNRDILDILEVSFDGLQELEKKIFLDIACFFKGSDKDHATKILDACGFYPDIGIQVLINKSLIKMLGNELWMHDWLQIMGREIVRREFIEEPGKRSRLWADADINHVLTKNTGTDAIEGIIIDLPRRTEAQWNVDSFSKMSKLRLLKIHNVHLYQGPKYLSNELRFLEWHGYPAKCLPSFYPEKLIELNLCYSEIQQLWKGKKAFENMKLITLSHSQNLTKTPDFTKIPNLERLVLKGCTRLCEVHPSIGFLRKLILLDLKDCISLRSLPSNIEMESLKIFVLSGCSKLEMFPEIIGKMELLLELYLDGTAIKELPSSIECLSGLVLLNLRDCKKLLSLPSNINGLKSLKTLILSGCSKLEMFPEIIGKMELLLELYLDGTAIKELPSSIECLSGLVLLNLRDCKKLLSLPSNINGLKSLKTLILSGCCKLETLPENLVEVESMEELDVSGTAIRQSTSSIFLLKNLKELSFHGCKGAPTKSWNLPPFFGLMQRTISDPKPLSLRSFTNLCSLRKLDLSDCNLGEGEIPNDIGCLSSLTQLNLSGNNFVSLPVSISQLYKLFELYVENCKSLQSLPELPSNIETMKASACTSLEMLPDQLIKVDKERIWSNGPAFDCISCFKLVENQGCSSMVTRIMKTYLQKVDNLSRRFQIVIPGDEIPEWFSYQTVGCEETMPYSPYLHNKSKLTGFALCSNFVVHQHPRILRYESFGTHWLHCFLKADDCTSSITASFPFKVKFGQAVRDHLWLIYLPRHRLPYFDEASQMGFSFGQTLGPGLEVKKFGLRPIYR